MRWVPASGLAFGMVLRSGVGVAQAAPPPAAPPPAAAEACSPASFRRVATLPNYLNDTDPSGATVSEIVASTRSGGQLVYTDALLGEVGFLDISEPRAAVSAGKLGMGGEPTSVAVLGENLALVAVNTSLSFSEPSGHLAVVDIAAQVVVAELPLGGQPDSVSISPSGRFAAIAIENERDEAVLVDGVEGGLPQAPSGFLAIVDLRGESPASWAVRRVELTGLSSYAPGDAEPEFVDVNDRDEAVVTLQENNHVVIVDLPTGSVVGSFAAGNVSLSGVDAVEDGIISLTDSIEVAREPDAVAWLPGRRGGLIATANEGDLFGGSRGFSIFDRSGRVLFDSGSSLEEIAVRHGHYPEARSDAKGSEPEAIEFARFGDVDYLFVGSERGSFVAVYELTRRGPEFVQLLPAPLGPEGVHAIPSRGLLVVSGEEDVPTFGVRSSLMIYELGAGAPTYPHILSADDAVGKPIAWSALSGMAALPGRSSELLAVWDSYYAESRIFSIDTSRSPALVSAATTIQGGSGNYDPEGIAIAPDGSLWIASEGDDAGRPNLLLQTDPSGAVLREVGLPSEIEACRAATADRATLASGFEGVSVTQLTGGYGLIVPQQRGWDYTTPECEALDDDPLDINPAQPSQTRLWIYDPDGDRWSHVGYELEPLPENASWVGLSEISSVPGGYVLIERDNRSGDFARLKTLKHIGQADLVDGLVSRSEKQSYDLIPDLLATHGWITDKPEGVAITSDGLTFVVTDNDGVDDWSGETWFLRLGHWRSLFGLE
jgi:Esterase-like activity of phytase